MAGLGSGPRRSQGIHHVGVGRVKDVTFTRSERSPIAALVTSLLDAPLS